MESNRRTVGLLPLAAGGRIQGWPMRNVAISLRSVYSSANTDECSRVNSLAGDPLVSHRKTTRKLHLPFEILPSFKRCEPYKIFWFHLFQNLQTRCQDWFVCRALMLKMPKKKQQQQQTISLERLWKLKFGLEWVSRSRMSHQINFWDK